MRIDSDWIYVLEHVLSTFHQFLTENDRSAQSSVNMEPYFMFFADFSYFCDGIYISLNRCTHRSVNQHTNIIFGQLCLDSLVKLFRDHSSVLVCFDVDNIFLPDSAKMCSLFHRIMRGFRGEYLQRLATVSLCLRTRLNSIPRSGYGHKIGKRPSWRENAINALPSKNLLEQIIDLILHQSETRRKFIRIHWPINCWCHHRP